MSTADSAAKTVYLSADRVQRRQRHRTQLSKSLLLSGSIIALFILVGALAPVVAPYDPLDVFPGQVLKPANRDHLLGTDELGRDLLSRTVFGARLSLFISICSVLISFLCGVSLGILAAYYGGVVDMIIMRLMDIILSFPSMILVIAVVAYLGNTVSNLIVVMGLLYTPGTARITYSAALSIKQMDYVEAAQMIGAPSRRIMLRHVLPNTIAPLLAHAGLSLGFVILTESGLSFLGLGPPPPTPTWGQMIAVGRRYIHRQPLLLAIPVFAVSLVIVAFNMLSDTLRDILDPRLKKA